MTTSSARGAIAASVASALMLWAAAPPVGVWWLAWVAIIPVAVVVVSAPLGRPARLAVPLAYALHLELLIVPALPFGLTAGQWGDPAVPVLIGDSPVLVVALVAIPLAGAALYAIGFGLPWLADRVASRASAAVAIAMPAIAFAALDFLRAKHDPGGLWGPLFLSQAGEPPARIAALGGPWLITVAIVAVNYGLALAIVRRRPAIAIAPIAAAIAAALVAPAFGGEPDRDAPGTVVAAVQPGYDTAERDRPQLRFFRRGTYHLAAIDLIEDLGELTREAAAGGAKVVVWPEASMFVDPRRHPRVRDALLRLAEVTGAVLVVPYFDRGPDRSAVVAAVPAAEEGAGAPGRGDPFLSAARPKQRPMWFLGETALDGSPRPIEAGRQRIGTLLGVDSQDARIAGVLAAEGATLLASSTHDWRQLAAQHAAFERLAARAAGLPLVRADWRYGSAIYGSDGAELASAGGDRRRTALVARVAPGDPTAYATGVGDAIGWLAVLTALAALIGDAALRRRSARRSTRT